MGSVCIATPDEPFRNMKTIQDTIRWGIIGCGDVCEVKSGPAFNKINHSQLVAVMRRDRARAEDFARRHNVPKFYDDATALINDPDINAIYIATPPAFHEEYAVASMAAGKPVYIEKPVSVNAAPVERMIAASERYQVPAVVAHYRRGLPLFRKVKELIHEGKLGRIQLILLRTLQPDQSKIITYTEDNWRVNPVLSGGGLFHDLSPHQLDILYWIFGDPLNIKGQAVNQLRQYDAPDVTSLEVTFAADVFMQGIWSFNMPVNVSEDSCLIVGARGSVSFSFFRNPGLRLHVEGNDGQQEMTFMVPENIQHPMIEQVVRYFRGEASDNPCSLREALVTMKIMDATLV